MADDPVQVNMNATELAVRVVEIILGMQRPDPDPHKAFAMMPADMRMRVMKAIQLVIETTAKAMGGAVSTAEIVDLDNPMSMPPENDNVKH